VRAHISVQEFAGTLGRGQISRCKRLLVSVVPFECSDRSFLLERLYGTRAHRANIRYGLLGR
jgi:hypothetical protein